MENSNGHIREITAVKNVSTGSFHANVIHNYVAEKTRDHIDAADNNNVDVDVDVVDDDHVNVHPEAPKEDVIGCVHYKRRAKFVVSY